MKMTFRWYGSKSDPIPLKYVKQIPGMTGLMGLLDKPAGVDWPEDEFKALVDEVHDAGLELERKVGWVRTRRGIVRFADKTDAEKDALIAKDPRYGNVVCRCEGITEAEIVEAIRRPVGARTLDDEGCVLFYRSEDLLE